MDGQTDTHNLTTFISMMVNSLDIKSQNMVLKVNRPMASYGSVGFNGSLVVRD